MKEHPILFSTPMVKAILEGRKTMTRRIARLKPAFNPMLRESDQWEEFIKKCPYGIIGDRLWVRETWAHVAGHTEYKADGFDMSEAIEMGEFKNWKPSIFMHRRDSRITLEIINVRVERLQEITEKDAIGEGVEEWDIGIGKSYKDYGKNFAMLDKVNARQSFFSLWETINGKGSWDSNPWVWVIEFKKL